MNARLLVCCLALTFFSSFLSAQPLILSVASETAPPGDTVLLPVRAENFSAISGYQGTVTWDTTVLDFVEITSPTSGLNNITGGPGQGTIPLGSATFLWVDFSGGSKTFPDSTAIMAFRFAIKANASPGITPVIINGSVTALGYSLGSGLLAPTINPGTINVNGCLSTADPTFSYPASVCANAATPQPTITGDPGGRFSVDNGAVIDSVSGILDPTSLVAGNTYLVTYQVGQPCPAFGTQLVQVLPPDDASFLLADTSCAAGSAPPVTVTGQAGGTFSVDNGALIDPQSGLLDLNSVSPATLYTVSYSTQGNCPNTTSQAIFFQPNDDAGFLFPDTVCTNDSDPVALVTGLAGGTFSVDQGASIDPATGQLALASLSVGTTYQVSYQTAGACPSLSTQSVVVQPPANASFTFPASVCPSGPNPQATLTGAPGGTFSVNPPAIIDPLTGELDLSSTTNGQTYTIFYDLTDGCAASAQQQITVADQQAPATPSLPTLTGDCALQLPVPTTSDNCAGTVSGTTSDPLQFATNGTYTVTWTFDDGNGNQTTAAQTLIIQDNTPPQVICQNLTLQLDTSGVATLTAAMVDGGSTDDCGIGQLSVNQETFTAADLGPNAVILTVTDVNGNSDFCAAVVTVTAFEPPVALCQDATVYLNSAGEGLLQPADLDGGSTVGIGSPQLGASRTQFSCADEGLNLVTFYVQDQNGLLDSCLAAVMVLDTLAPFPLLQDVTLYLDSAGQGSLTVADIDQGSYDACGLAEISLATDTFGCDQLGLNLLPVTLSDIHGNERLATTGVTVADTLAPVVVCQDLTVQLDANGLAVVAPALVDAGSADNCALASLRLSQDTFGVAEVGENEVWLIATDASGNADSCLAQITVAGASSNGQALAEGRWEVFPNPTQGPSQLRWEAAWQGRVELLLWNQLGQVVWRQSGRKTGPEFVAQVDLTHLPQGVYALQLVAGEAVYTRRLRRE